MLDDVLDVSGPAERTGKQRGTDLLDGTVTLPLILAREPTPSWRELDLRALDAREQAEAVCDRIAATGALERHAHGRTRAGRRGQGGAGGQRRRRICERAAGDVADRVVERYS